MFRKALVFIIIISPLLFLLVGYPIRQIAKPTTITNSQRCFAIGDTKAFITCFQHLPRISSIQLINQTVSEVNSLQQNMGFAFLIFLVISLLLLPFLL